MSGIPVKRVRKPKVEPTREEIKAHYENEIKELKKEIEDMDQDLLTIKPLLPNLKWIPETIENSLEEAQQELEDLEGQLVELNAPVLDKKLIS